MLSVDLAGGRAAGQAFIDALTIPERTASLGSVHTMVVHPPTSSHRSLDAASLAAAGITEGLLRVSVGLEDEADLVADFGQALDAANAASPSAPTRPRPADAGRHRVGRPPSRPSPPGGRRNVPRRASRRARSRNAVWGLLTSVDFAVVQISVLASSPSSA